MATFGTFVAGQVLTAAELNGAGTWTDYTPSWTQSATITKTVNWARYTQFNKIVMGSVKMTATSSGTANNKMLIGLPVAASSNNFVMGTMTFFDSTEANYPYVLNASIPVLYETSTTVSFGPRMISQNAVQPGFTADIRFGQNASGATGVQIVSGDIVYIQFQYEAA